MFTRVIFFALLFGFWLLLSSQHTVWMITLGVVSAALVFWLSSRMKISGTQVHTVGVYLRLPRYSVWLLRRIIVSNITVAWVMLQPKLLISPEFIRVPMTQKKDLGKLVHANSITLTPGTVSTDIGDDYIEVHRLIKQDDDEQVEFDRRATWLEGKN